MNPILAELLCDSLSTPICPIYTPPRVIPCCICSLKQKCNEINKEVRKTLKRIANLPSFSDLRNVRKSRAPRWKASHTWALEFVTAVYPLTSSHLPHLWPILQIACSCFRISLSQRCYESPQRPFSKLLRTQL